MIPEIPKYTLEEGRKQHAELAKEDPALKLYHVVLDGPLGLSFDGYWSATSEREAWQEALRYCCDIRPNDFNKYAEEVEP